MSEFTVEGEPEKANGPGRLSIAAAEFLGTAVLLFIACLGAAVEGPGIIQSSLASGLAVMTVIHIFGHISGAHVNPVTTICAYIMGKIDLALVPVYFGAQMGGAAAGFGLLKLILPRAFIDRRSHGVAMTLPMDNNATSIEIFSVELVITVILSFANCASWDPRTSRLNDSLALRFGFLVAALNLIAVPFSGCSMNPVRSFGPALWYNDWTLQWIYWVSPISAAFIGSGIYKFLLLNQKQSIVKTRENILECGQY